MIFDYTLSSISFWPEFSSNLSSTGMTLPDFALRVGLALLMGSLIGAEREWRHKLAGLKTNALVCVGSALFTCIGYQAAATGHADPTRIAGQIASGIGFLGAGAILRDGLTIRGLTTAATVWCAAAIGTMAGAGMLVHAVVGTGFIFGCNFALKEMAGMLFKYHSVDAPVEQDYVLNFYTKFSASTQRKQIVDFFDARKLSIRSLNIEPIASGSHWVLTVQSTDFHIEPSYAEKMADEFWTAFDTQLNWRLD